MFKYETESNYCTITGYEGNVPKELIIPETIDGKEVCSISDDAFAGCSTIERVILPATVKRIGHRAFADCPNLAEINLDAVDFIFSDWYNGITRDVSQSRFKN